jgi:guanylate kinase
LPTLSDHIALGQIPIVHVGQVAAVAALLEQRLRWLTVLLWCTRQVSAQRLRNRGAADVEARLTAWDETRADLLASPCDYFVLKLRTDELSPVWAAHVIDAKAHGTDTGYIVPSDLAEIIRG